MSPTPTNPKGAGRTTLDTYADILRALMWGKSKTPDELAEEAGTSKKVVRRWLEFHQAAGVVYIAARPPKAVDPKTGDIPTGNRPVYWALQPKPHAMPDAPVPVSTLQSRRSRERRRVLDRRQAQQP